MTLAKWGNSLAARIPAEVVEKLGLLPAEEIQFVAKSEKQFEIDQERKRLDAIEKMRELKFTLPDDYVFNREELHERESIS